MTKSELITAMAEKTGMMKKDSEAVLNALLQTIEETLVKKEKVQLIGFGTFETRERAARQGRNPRQPEKVIKIDAYTSACFKPGKALKDKVND